MKKKVIIIDISENITDKSIKKNMDILSDLQMELFKNGYKWIKNGNQIEKYFSMNSSYIAIVDNEMYTISEESLRYLSKEVNIINYGTVTSYFRYLKIKKLNII